MITKFSTFLDNFLTKFSIVIFSKEDFAITLAQLILAIITLTVSLFVIHFISKKILHWKYLIDLDEQHQSIPIVKLIRSILYIICLFIFLTILGFPAAYINFVWRFPIFSIKDSHINLGNLLIGIIFFIFAFRIYRVFKPKTEQYIDKSLKLDHSSQRTILTIIEYLIVFVIFLFSLSIIGIPLTAFTFIGGTLAIGVGFGSQNLINNFISGFVLMGERTTKIGDIIEVGTNTGVVEKIGFRSTVIKTFNNLRLIIPNSTLLENNVINWSLTDKILRRKITVGIAYGADAIKVHDLLLQCAKAREDINHTPEPFVVFNDFGDNALLFDIYIFIDMSNKRNTLKIESDLRTDIYQTLILEGISIPFPQRDVHFYQDKPFDVRLQKD
ncbi:MAG: mechanosensitive ion channel [Candidatus Marinimicrobia bacterium]|nr:mechanosensitive ion channel [Candidatus Neomarinimicrobiota bacterium]